jgi:transcriptional regulator NrdR family protein
MGIQCPRCQSVEWQVLRTLREPGLVKRQRKCRGCGCRLSTLEGGLQVLQDVVAARTNR